MNLIIKSQKYILLYLFLLSILFHFFLRIYINITEIIFFYTYLPMKFEEKIVKKKYNSTQALLKNIGNNYLILLQNFLMNFF